MNCILAHDILHLLELFLEIISAQMSYLFRSSCDSSAAQTFVYQCYVPVSLEKVAYLTSSSKLSHVRLGRSLIKDVNEPRNICDVRSIPILMNDQNPTEQTSARMQYNVNSHDTPSVYLLRQHAQLHRHHAILVVLLNIGFLHGISNTAPILPVQRARLAYLAHILVPPPW